MKSLIALPYKYILKPILFKFDPERVHDCFLKIGEVCGKSKFVSKIITKFFDYTHPMLKQEIDGINYKNPVGLAAGFDKDAQLTQVLPSVGFGYFEIGSITAKPYEGNPKPRLKRFPKTKSIWVNYGLKNTGAQKIREKLDSQKFSRPVYFSIAKTNSKETADQKKAIADYCESIKVLRDIAPVFVINISCPNAYGGQPFHEPKDLDKLLQSIDDLRVTQPVFLKISPEISNDNLDKILHTCDSHKINGIIISNLGKKKIMGDIDKSERRLVKEHGGLSGKYIEERSNKMLEYVARRVKSKRCKEYTLIGLGGIFSAEDAYKKIKLGASLVQLITGMIFEGPQLIGQINEGLVKLLKRDGYKSIAEAVGADLK